MPWLPGWNGPREIFKSIGEPLRVRIPAVSSQSIVGRVVGGAWGSFLDRFGEPLRSAGRIPWVDLDCMDQTFCSRVSRGAFETAEHRQSRSHCLLYDQRKAFADRRQDQCVGRPIEIGKLASRFSAEEPHVGQFPLARVDRSAPDD